MSTKSFYEEVSEALGLGGEITPSVEVKAKRLLDDLQSGKIKCKDHDGETLKFESFGGLFWGDVLCRKAREEREQFLESTNSN